MPRKKVIAAQAASAGVTSITCPGCKSSVSSDGSTLHARSEYLDALIETDKSVEELEKEFGEHEKKRVADATVIADLRALLKKAEEKHVAPVVTPKEKTTNVDTKSKAGAGSGSGGKSSWW